MEFIADLADQFEFQAHTAGLACALFDRFVRRSGGTCESEAELELAAAVCLRIAAKFAETTPPQPEDLCSLLQVHPVSSSRRMNQALLNQKELAILDALDWELHVLTPHPVLDKLLIILNEPAAGAAATRARLLIDMSFYSASTCTWRPTAVAAAAILLAKSQLGSASSSQAKLVSSICRAPMHVIAGWQDTMLRLFEQMAVGRRPALHCRSTNKVQVPSRDVSPMP